MRIIFAGTTSFGIPTLEKLQAKSYKLEAIITQPDQMVGRKKTLTPPPIKVWAEKHGIPVIQSDRIKNQESRIRETEPDLLLVAAYGQIIPKDILDIPKFGSINIHGSLLPKYRGGTPIQTAILNGDTITGIALIKMDAQMDHGPIVAKTAITVADDDNYDKLHAKLSDVAAKLVDETLPKWFAGQIQPDEQDHSAATFTKIYTYADGRIDWTKPAALIWRKIKALNPEPGTWTTLDKKSVKITEATLIEDSLVDLPGKIYSEVNNLAVKCQSGSLKVLKLQPEGKKPMTGRDFLNGLKGHGNKMFI